MAEVNEESLQIDANIVLTGVPDSGKAAILRQMAQRYAHDSVLTGEVAEARVCRTGFFWPELLPNGGRLRLELYAVSGKPHYNAVDELLLERCAGLVFVADVREERLYEAREALRSLVFNAGRNRFELDAMPVALQYTRTDYHPGFVPEQMDQWLGIPPGSVTRFVSGASQGENLCEAVEWVVQKIASEVVMDEEPAMP